MKTLLLLLLPFTALCQSPPCLSTAVSATAFSFDFNYPAACEYLTSWMDDYIPCHGAMNRRPGFMNLTVVNDTTYTVTAATGDGDPANLVWSIWDACPFQGGNVVASVECGGWDCIEYGNIGFQAVVSLPAGTYWIWAGMYSNGVTCTQGLVSGQMSIGGDCIVPPPPVYAPCPTHTVTVGNTTIDYCGEQTGVDMDIVGYPCGQFDMYVTVEFTTDGTPYPIQVVSDANYVDFPTTPINHQAVYILDGCNGNIVASSRTLSCAISGYCGQPMDQEYTAIFCLPAGTYVAYIGYMNNNDLPFNTYFQQEGCISYTFGHPVFLNGAQPPIDLPNIKGEDAAPLYPRYTKVVIEGRGVYIRDAKDGRLYDLRTRRIVE